MWIRPGTEVLSIREHVFMVSPNNYTEERVGVSTLDREKKANLQMQQSRTWNLARSLFRGERIKEFRE